MTDRHEHLDEGTVHAWLDGALPPDESQRVEVMAASCAECAAIVAEARGLVAASSRILASLDAVPGGVIPGSGDRDQLAALRARRAATSRRWWQDRRVVVAASLVFVAGVSSLVLRSPSGQMATSSFENTADSAVPAPEPSPVVADAPTSPTPAAVREAARDMKAETSPPPAAPSPIRTAQASADSSAEQKVAGAPSLARAPMVAGNEARRIDSGAVRGRTGSVDSNVVARLEQAAPQRQLRQQAAAPALQGLQQQSRVDSVQRAQSAFAIRSRMAAPVGVGAASAMADAAQLAGNCYRLRALSSGGGDAVVVPDTVHLLNEMVPVLSDPSWFRARPAGVVRDTTLAWRQVDSVTVELRSRLGSDSTAVRFTTTGDVPDVRGTGLRPALAIRVNCP